jgi:cold shock CspA family protein
MISRGTVREWSDDGYGVVDSADTPGGCWVFHISVAQDGFRALTPGDEVAFTFERARQDGFEFRALVLWPPRCRARYNTTARDRTWSIHGIPEHACHSMVGRQGHPPARQLRGPGVAQRPPGSMTPQVSLLTACGLIGAVACLPHLDQDAEPCVICG